MCSQVYSRGGEIGQTTFWILRETSLSSRQCQNEHGLKCQWFNWVAEAECTYSGENDVLFFFFFGSLCLVVIRPACLTLFLNSVVFTSLAKLESVCQSKHYFNILHITSTSVTHCLFLLLVLTLSYHRLRDFTRPHVVYFNCLCVRVCLVVCVCVSSICAKDKIHWEEDEYFLICSTAGKQVVALLTDVIKW